MAMTSRSLSRRGVLKAGAAAFSTDLALAVTSAAAERRDDDPGGTSAIAVYAGAMSCLPGESLAFHVSTTAPRYTATITRVGAEPQVVWTSEPLAGGSHPTPPDASTHGCRWPVAFRVPIGSDWRSGVYVARLEGGGGSTETFFIVRGTAATSARILFQLSTNTYQAYNGWGGTSLYSGPKFPRVSFDRPFIIEPPQTGRVDGFYNPNLGCFRTWDEPLIRWAEQSGYEIDYAANLDLEADADLLARYRLVLSVGHDEYWSAGMRDRLEEFIAKGGNAAFLSGNSVCWQTRVEDGGRTLVCHKRAHETDPVFGTQDQRLLTTLWSSPLVGRPENRLTGVGFPYGGYNGFFDVNAAGPGAGEYTVHRPEHWLFSGTGLERGEAFGRITSPCPQPGIAGYECDGCEMIWRDGLPFPTGRDGTPETMEILATAPARWSAEDGTVEWAADLRREIAAARPPADLDIDAEGAAVFGIFKRGGTVVTTGSCGWSYGLAAGNHVVDRIVRNLIDRLSA